MAQTESPLLQAAYDVRRHIGLVLVVGILVGLAGYVAIGSISPDWKATAAIEIFDQNTTAVLLELDPPFPTRSAGSVAAALQDLADADNIKDLQALPSEPDRQVLVTIEGSSRDIGDVLEKEIDKFIASQLTVLTAQIDSAVTAAQTRLTDLDTELKAIDALAATDPTDDVVRLRRLEAQHDLSDARKRLVDFTTLRGGLQGGLRRIQAADAVKPGAGSASRILAPAILAVLVGLGVGIGAGRLDSRLRTGARISAASGGLPLLGVVSAAGTTDEDGLLALSLAIRHVASKVSRPVVIVPLSSQRAGTAVSSAVPSDLASVTQPISSSSEGVSAAADGKAVILLVDSQVDRPRNLKQAVQLLSAVGVTAEGVVLVVDSPADRLRALVDSSNG